MVLQYLVLARIKIAIPLSLVVGLPVDAPVNLLRGSLFNVRPNIFRIQSINLTFFQYFRGLLALSY